jgi:hypothetical protein
MQSLSILRNTVFIGVAAMCVPVAWCQSTNAAQAAAATKQAAAAQTAPKTAPPARKVTRFRAQRESTKARGHYMSTWGVDKMTVNYTASGNLIRFSYRVSDPERAKTLGDKHNAAYLLGVRSHAVLQVPVMDKVGALRQAAPPEAGREYWMVFSNKGNLVRPGDRVNVMIGAFHADGLMVE